MPALGRQSLYGICHQSRLCRVIQLRRPMAFVQWRSVQCHAVAQLPALKAPSQTIVAFTGNVEHRTLLDLVAVPVFACGHTAGQVDADKGLAPAWVAKHLRQ